MIDIMWSWLSDNSGTLQGLGGVAAVGAALVAVFALMRAGFDSASRTRPYVVVEYRVPEYAYKRIDLVIRNAGPTAARDLSVEFTPPFENSTESGDLGAYVARRFASSIDVLGPGQEFASILLIDTADDAKSDVGPVLQARVKYGPKKASRLFRRYSDNFSLQRVAYAEQVFSESSDSIRNRVKAISRTLADIEKGVSKQESALDRLSTALALTATSAPSVVDDVAWRLYPTSYEQFALYNLGTATAREVKISADDRIGVHVVDGELEEVRPGEAVVVVFVFRGGSKSARLVVDWAGTGGERHETSVMIPVWIA